MLTIEVVGDADAEEIADRLRLLDVENRLSVTCSPDGGGSLAGFRIVARSRGTGMDPAADVVLESVDEVEKLWATRLRTFAAGMAGEPVESYPAVLHPSVPEWHNVAQLRITRLRRSLAAVDPGGAFTYEHIGSTSVPGLAAKAIVDLQVLVPRIPEAAELEDSLHRIGFLPALGSRPDSPGVYRDIPRGDEVVPDEVWTKRLFYLPDPELPSILHIRRVDSPFARHGLLFRDWLRANPAQRDRYQRVKVQVAEAHANDADYDDYTRGKSRYFDEIHQDFEDWGRLTDSPYRRH
jgi:dephospho-CoA kinase